MVICSGNVVSFGQRHETEQDHPVVPELRYQPSASNGKVEASAQPTQAAETNQLETVPRIICKLGQEEVL